MDYEHPLRAKLASLKSAHNYRVFAELDPTNYAFPVSVHDGLTPPQPVVVWCSNDYLGMSRNPVVIAALCDAAHTAGAGSGGSRNIAGTTTYHSRLEATLARLHGKARSLLFASAFLANENLFRLLGKAYPECVFFSDQQNHASMIEGMIQSGAEKCIFRHNDVGELVSLLKSCAPNRPKIIAVESVYSVDGDTAPVNEIAEIASRYGAMLIVDEVNGVGLYGEKGAGLTEELGLTDKIDLIVGTFGKAFGLAGGYIAGSETVIDYIRSFAPGFIFTTSPPTCIVAATLASLQYVRENPELRRLHRTRTEAVVTELRALGIPIMRGADRHIIPVLVGNSDRCKRLTSMLLKQYGIYLQPITFPTVPVGTERVRITPTPFHTPEMIAHLAASLDACWREFNLPRAECQ